MFINCPSLLPKTSPGSPERSEGKFVVLNHVLVLGIKLDVSVFARYEIEGSACEFVPIAEKALGKPRDTAWKISGNARAVN